MSRTQEPHAGRPCERCRRVPAGGLWVSRASKPLDFGNGLIMECDTSKPNLCDPCEMLDRLADPQYAALCWPHAASIEQESLKQGGVRPPQPTENDQ